MTDNEEAMNDFNAAELLKAIREALARPEALHRLAERYEQSVHDSLARGENPERSPDDDR